MFRKDDNKLKFVYKYMYIVVIGLILLLGISYGLTFFVNDLKIAEINISAGGLTVNGTNDNSIALTSLSLKTDTDCLRSISK